MSAVASPLEDIDSTSSAMQMTFSWQAPPLLGCKLSSTLPLIMSVGWVCGSIPPKPASWHLGTAPCNTSRPGASGKQSYHAKNRSFSLVVSSTTTKSQRTLKSALCMSAQKAFYGLQSAGLHFRGVEPRVSAKLYCVGVRTVLMYGAEAVALSQADIKKMQKTQGKCRYGIVWPEVDRARKSVTADHLLCVSLPRDWSGRWLRRYVRYR